MSSLNSKSVKTPRLEINLEPTVNFVSVPNEGGRFQKHLSDCLSFGVHLVVEEVDEVFGSLASVGDLTLLVNR